MSLKQPTNEDIQDIFKKEITKAMDKEFGHVEEIAKLTKALELIANDDRHYGDSSGYEIAIDDFKKIARKAIK